MEPIKVELMAKEGKLNEVEQARIRWLNASESASSIASELFHLGSGYGDPEARNQDEHRLQSARHEAERLFCEYHDLDRREMDAKLLELQKSQRLATWPHSLWQQAGASLYSEIVLEKRLERLAH